MNKNRFSWSWSNPKVRGTTWQLILVVGVIIFCGFIFKNTEYNLSKRGIQFGYGFLTSTAGFDISEFIINYQYDDSYIRAFLVGIANTVKVAILGIVLASILGVLVGIGRLSRNGLIRIICLGYVEAIRNIPLLLQLFVWYFVIIPALPHVEKPIKFVFGVMLSKAGLALPYPEWALGWTIAVSGFILALILIPVVLIVQRKILENTGKNIYALPVQILLILILPICGWLIGGAPSEFEFPEINKFGIIGGANLTPEFVSLLLGLSVYTSSYIAEIVRAGISSVPLGQKEAAKAIGLTTGQSMRYVLFPQALRVIIPPVTSQYLNLTKNSSLAVAIGYPDVVSVANTTLNQSGRAMEAISIIMMVYLIISLGTSVLMNWYNARKALVER